MLDILVDPPSVTETGMLPQAAPGSHRDLYGNPTFKAQQERIKAKANRNPLEEIDSLRELVSILNLQNQRQQVTLNAFINFLLSKVDFSEIELDEYLREYRDSHE
jgi:hypothetical protein